MKRKSIKIENGKYKWLASGPILFAIRLLAAERVCNNPEDEEARALYDSLPGIDEITNSVGNMVGTKCVWVGVHHIFLIEELLKVCPSGVSWPKYYSLKSKIADLKKIPVLHRLAMAAEQETK